MYSSFKGDGVANPKEIDRFSEGVGWMPYPDEKMGRSSHALSTDGGVYLVDPVGGDGVEDIYSDLGHVAGVVVTLRRHKRDATEFAERHDVPIYVPEWMRPAVEDDLGGSVKSFVETLPGTEYKTIKLYDNPFWKESVLYDGETLVVPEAVGTVDHFCAKQDRIGVHPFLRLTPPMRLLSCDPDRVLFGHGEGVLDDDPSAALHQGITKSRRRMPGLYLKNFRDMVLP